MSRVAYHEATVETTAVNRRTFLKLSGSAALAGMASTALGSGNNAPPTPDRRWMASQVGYLPQAAKVATLQWPANAAGSAQQFRVSRLSPDGTPGHDVHRGSLSAPMQDALSGDRVQLADFSAVKEPGRYMLQLDHGGPAVAPLEFTIGDDVYRQPLWHAIRGYYGQRCGCSVNLGGGYEHPPCHLNDGFDATSGKTGPFKNYGGWHDAGDYGRYMVN